MLPAAASAPRTLHPDDSDVAQGAPPQVDQVRAAWHGVHCKGLSDRDALDVYLRQSGLLQWQYSDAVDVQETVREDPLHKQWGQDTPIA